MELIKMKIWKFIKALPVIIGLQLCLLLSLNVTAESVKSLELKPGLWEGINNNVVQYSILEINEDGNHRFFIANIASAFKKAKKFDFTDENISCTTSECIINIKRNSEASSRLILAPYLENSFKVIEINTNADGKAIFSQTYQLDQQKDQSTVRSFIKKYQHHIESLSLHDSDGIYGFWLGVLVTDDKPELLSLEVHHDKKSTFTLFINGQNFVNETAFLTKNMIIKDRVINITTEHPTFANKLIINQLSSNMLSGYMYSVYKGNSLQTGKFSLFRVR